MSATVNRQAALMPYYVNITDASTYSLNGGITVRMFYDPADKAIVDGLHSANSWIYYPGTVSAMETSFTIAAPVAYILTVIDSGVTTTGLGFVDVKISSGGTVAYMAYEDILGLAGCTIIYSATDPNSILSAGTHLLAYDSTTSLQLENETGSVPSVAGLTPLTVGNVQYDTVGKRWYVWTGTEWIPVDNATNTNLEPSFNGLSAGQIIFNLGHVWGWTGTAWKQLDN